MANQSDQAIAKLFEMPRLVFTLCKMKGRATIKSVFYSAYQRPRLIYIYIRIATKTIKDQIMRSDNLALVIAVAIAANKLA